MEVFKTHIGFEGTEEDFFQRKERKVRQGTILNGSKIELSVFY